jgi:diacylglycerol kinase (ATP)
MTPYHYADASIGSRIGHQHPSTALVIFNPAAGAADPDLCSDVVAVCRAAGSRAIVFRTSRRGDAVTVVEDAVRDVDRSGVHIVIAVGGDGTVREVAEGFARGLGRWPAAGNGSSRDRVALLVVPAGTGNSVYRALWGDAPWPDVLRRVCTGGTRIRSLDLARLVEFDRAVLLGASAGLTARITELAQELPQLAGRERYWTAAAQALSDLQPFPAEVAVDQVVIHHGPANLVAVGGGRYRAGVFQLLPRSVLDDARLDVCTVGTLASSDVPNFAALIPEGKHVGRPEVSYAQGARVTITRTDGEPMLFEHDGDMLETVAAQITLDVVAGAVPAFAPDVPLAG